MVALRSTDSTGGGTTTEEWINEFGDASSLLDLGRDDVIIDLTDTNRSRAVLRVANDGQPRIAHGRIRRVGWRLADLAYASTMLLITMPLMGVLAILVRVTSAGPVIFRQERIGRSGIAFDCLKFRTMHADSEERLVELLASDPDARNEWLRDHKLRADPRITRLGRLIRKTNLDELPQLLNVLNGTMSMVGPRPVVPTETIRYGEHILEVLSVKPGITGLWQVSGRNDLPYAERVALDLDYVAAKSAPRDLAIGFRTITTMITGRGNGAY